MNIVGYNSSIHDQLMSFLQNIYPQRDKSYFEWWLESTKEVSKEKKERTFCIVCDSKIIACTLSYWSKLKVCDHINKFYWEANTIVDPKYRGKGIGRMIYEQMDKYRDRCTTGFTDSAFKIQFKILKNIKHISTVSVYLSFTHCIIRTIVERLFHIDLYDKELAAPDFIRCKHLIAKRVETINDFEIPDNGIWLNQNIEVIRDKDFIYKRFFDIYKKYYVYQIYDKTASVGYFVVRRTKYMGLNMLSLVDYRLSNIKSHTLLLRLVRKIATLNKIGLIITLTSQSGFNQLYPLTIQTSKKLYGGTTMAEIEEGQDFLITSADSDLDFVYYK